MVTEGGAHKKPSAPIVTITEKHPRFSLEELEQRLETTLLRIIHVEPCNCLGALCQCDGQDCVGVCETYCLIHYI